MRLPRIFEKVRGHSEQSTCTQGLDKLREESRKVGFLVSLPGIYE